jgi:hypothetical protein
LLTLSASYGAPQSITLSGAVYAEAGPNGQPPPSGGGLAGRTVLFSGGASGRATTDANGNYRVTLQVAAPGAIHGVTADGRSNAVDLPLTDNSTTDTPGPVIDRLIATREQGNLWTFSGHVIVANPQGLFIYFGGEPDSLQGQRCPVEADGTFSLTIELNGTPSDNGMATATITDWLNRSDTATCGVNQ